MTQTTDSVNTYTLSDFDYDLPSGRVARYPLAERDQSKLMVVNRKQRRFSHHHFYDLPRLLNPGDLLVVNNARVIPARLHGRRDGHTGHVELFLMHPEDAFKTRWQVLMRPARKLPPGTRLVFDGADLGATVLERASGGRGRVALAWPPGQTLDEILEAIGQMPIPPYLERPPEALDQERYQTVFAAVPGAQAAPTAGLHFTPRTFADLKARGVEVAQITLHVSAGTFRPVLTEAIHQHQMDPELYTLPPETVAAVEKTRQNGGRVVAVGTTVAKTLETVAHRHHGVLQPETAWSDLFIAPGFKFQAIDGLVTNFHLPRSTLLMLVSAFSDRHLMLDAYHEAIAQNYRFYSYGDCMLIE